jgi:N6-adenosine-specific RNA methylase IME4
LAWDKEIIGLGYWFRNQHELLLVGSKGRFSSPQPTLRVSSVLRERRREHSQKPGVIRQWISEWYPTQAKLELFAREKTEGWDCWGNELESDIIIVPNIFIP